MPEIHLNLEKPKECDIEVWLHEANEIILKIDMEELRNNHQNRNYAKWRLTAIQRYYNNQIDEQFRSMYNSLWSQLYRLEHSANFTHPYIKTLLTQLYGETVYVHH